ncbi:hypothetical protein RN001_014891 [Aquatica leii]|uniref:Protein sleepless n=1 Tax=Aquatica leii TaxID=1421715 RepID=A0AAN7NYD1_9COLE|nr:hypothetical protein RN001_014891 [Aquatica leii]
MFKFLCFIVLVALHLGTVCALTCHRCLASTNSDCYRGVEASFIKEQCSSNTVSNLSVLKNLTLNKTLSFETVCVSVVFSGYWNDYIERGCGFIYKGEDICEYLDSVSYIESCSYCTANFCNSKSFAL